MRLHGIDRQAQLKLGAAVGRQKTSVQREDDDAFDQSAQEFRAAMKVNPHGVGKHIGKHVVFDHLRRHAHQRHGVLVVAALIARHVQCAHDLAVGVKDGGAGAGQELVGLQKVVVPMHDHGLALGQGGANRVGAFALFGPFHAGHQGHAGGFFQKIGIAQRVQDQPVARRQQHHAVRVGNLFVQGFHDGAGVLVQQAVFITGVGNGRGLQLGEVGFFRSLEPERMAAPVRLQDRAAVVVTVQRIQALAMGHGRRACRHAEHGVS